MIPFNSLFKLEDCFISGRRYSLPKKTTPENRIKGRTITLAELFSYISFDVWYDHVYNEFQTFSRLYFKLWVNRELCYKYLIVLIRYILCLSLIGLRGNELSGIGRISVTPQKPIYCNIFYLMLWVFNWQTVFEIFSFSKKYDIFVYTVFQVSGSQRFRSNVFFIVRKLIEKQKEIFSYAWIFPYRERQKNILKMNDCSLLRHRRTNTVFYMHHNVIKTEILGENFSSGREFRRRLSMLSPFFDSVYN